MEKKKIKIRCLRCDKFYMIELEFEEKRPDIQKLNDSCCPKCGAIRKESLKLLGNRPWK